VAVRGDARGARSAPADEAVARRGLGWLLHGRDASIAVGDTPAAIRARLDQLRGEEIVELKRGAYRATPIALYRTTSFRLPAAHPGTDKRMRRITVIG
jgi:hypothetical protein